MATANRTRLRVVGNKFWPEGGMPIETNIQNKSAETAILPGVPVQMDGTPELIVIPDANLVAVATPDDRLDVSDITASLAAKIFGFTLKSFPATGQIKVPIALWVPGIIVEANLNQAKAGDTVVDHVSALTDLYSQVGLLKGDDGIWSFTVEGTEFIGQVIGFPGILGDAVSGGNIGDTNARVHVLLHDNIGTMQHAGA